MLLIIGLNFFNLTVSPPEICKRFLRLAQPRRRVAAGEWEPGQRMPPVSELADAYDTSRATVTKAPRKLASEGLVTIVPNWGTFRAEDCRGPASPQKSHKSGSRR